MNETAEEIIRKEAVYFVKGKWPKVVIEQKINSELIKNGSEVVIAIIPIEKTTGGGK